LRAEDDIRKFSRWRGLNLPDTGNVRVMSAAYPEYSPATSITTVSPASMRFSLAL